MRDIIIVMFSSERVEEEEEGEGPLLDLNLGQIGTLFVPTLATLPSRTTTTRHLTHDDDEEEKRSRWGRTVVLSLLILCRQ